MQNNGSVMNGLHKISGKIAEASRSHVSPPPPAENPWADTPAAVPPPVRTQTEPPPAAVPRSYGMTPEPSSKKSGSILGDALLRRYEDFLKTRRDLAARIVRETERLRTREEDLQRELEEIRSHLEQLKGFARETDSTDDSVDPGNQAAFAAECRKIEHLRLELFRIGGQTDPADGKKAGGKSTDPASFLSLFNSLTFGQLARAGFAFLFPFLAVLVFAVLLLAAAIILSFNGAFVW